MNAIAIDDTLLGQWPLPTPSIEDDKERRGRALVIAGSRELPGAPLLAGESALRSGCGKVLVGTAASIATAVGIALPEARVVRLPEREGGGLAGEGVAMLAPWSDRVASLLIGPGLVGKSCGDFVRGLLPAFATQPAVLDAAAMDVVTSTRRDAPTLVTPHAGEMAHLAGIDKDAVARDPEAAAAQAAARWGVIVVLKGAVTIVATPQGALWRHDGHGLVGLATSGSGDVLAGLIAGLAARGASLEQAAVWGVALHARAAAVLARRVGTLGYVARELAAEVPALMQERELPAASRACALRSAR